MAPTINLTYLLTYRYYCTMRSLLGSLFSQIDNEWQVVQPLSPG